MAEVNLIGMKLFKEEGDNIHLIRVIRDKKTEDKELLEVTVIDNGEEKTMKKDELKGFTPLQPDAILTASIIEVESNTDGSMHKDVIVTTIGYEEMKDTPIPYAICRQSVTDIFNQMFVQSTENEMAGLAINRDDCPANFSLGVLLAASKVDYHIVINYYRNDTLDDILEMIPQYKFNEVLGELYAEHCKACGVPIAYMKNRHMGWCKTLKDLLEDNSFQVDINQMLSITELDFRLSPYIDYKPININAMTENETTIYTGVLKQEVTDWLSSIYNINIKEANVIEYDHDINLEDFSKSKFMLLRDSDKVLYLVIYTEEGEYLEADLVEKQKDFSDVFRLKFYNKYNINDNK